MGQDYILLVAILFPILCGALMFAFDRLSLNRNLKLTVIFAMLVIEAIIVGVCLTGDYSLLLWKLNSKFDISFKVDMISVIFAALCVVIWILVAVFSFSYMSHSNNENRYFGFYLIVLGTLIALAFSGNIVTFYIFFELMTLTSLPLVLHDLTHEAIMAGLKYLFYSIAGAFMALFGVFMLAGYGILGSFSAGGILDATAVSGNEGIVLVSALLMIMGFGVKAGMFPMHAWLPTAHPVAPASASAVLSGVITKMGVLGMIRSVFFSIGPKYIYGTYVQTVWIILALITVFMGSMMAYREKIMKKRFAYSTVSQVSYMIFGLAIMNETAFVGAVSHVVFHSLIKNTLFLVAGAIIFKTGKTKVEQLRGIGKEMPIVIWCYSLVSLALIGIPPTSGFVSKWMLATGSLSSNIPVFSWLGPVVLLISALLTAGYLLPITIQGFFPGNDYDYSQLQSKEPSWLMYVPMIIMTVLAVVFGMFPQIIMGPVSEIAHMIFG